MRKSKMVLLAAALAVAVSAPAVSADRAGIGLNWAIGPATQLGPFDMEFSNGFTLGWKVTDRFTVGVFREDAQMRGEHTYSCNSTAGHVADIKHTLVLEGDTTSQGLSFLTNLIDLPIVGSLAVGLDIGTQIINVNKATVSDSDGGASVTEVTGFGYALAFASSQITAPIMGVAAKLRVLEFETKTVSTCIDVNANLRVVPFSDKTLFGDQENHVTLAAGETYKKIDPVGNYNTLNLTVGVGLWF